MSYQGVSRFDSLGDYLIVSIIFTSNWIEIISSKILGIYISLRSLKWSSNQLDNKYYFVLPAQ